MTQTRARTGTNRRRFDHDAALAVFVSLGPTRTLSDVAKRFKVSVQAIAKVAKADNWFDVAAKIDREAAEKALRRVRRSREQRVEQALRIVDGTLLLYEQKLEDIAGDVKPQDVVALTKLAELLEGEATSRISISELQPLLNAFEQAVAELEALARQVDPDATDRAVARLDDELTAIASARAASVRGTEAAAA